MKKTKGNKSNKRYKIISALLILTMFMPSTIPITQVQAASSGTVSYGSAGNNGSVYDLGWLITVEQVNNEFIGLSEKEKEAALNDYKNAELYTMDLFRTSISYINPKSKHKYSPNEDDAILIVDKASYGSNLSHTYYSTRSDGTSMWIGYNKLDRFFKVM